MEGRVKFRLDLEAYDYDDIEDRETMVLKDPVSGKYFYLSTYEYRFLKTLDGNVTLEEAIDRITYSGYHYPLEEAQAIVAKAAQLGLVLGTKFSTAQFQQHVKDQVESAKKARRAANIYFSFIPLLNPDKFLERTLWLPKLLANKLTLAVMALALPGAIYCILTGFQKMETEYLFFFNLENLIYLWITIALTKLIHEFAHAYVAKSFGLHVPEMGVAFLIFFPCLFCNTTDAWQLADRKQRIAISAAGILIEGAMAIASTYVWYFSDPGIINSLAFYLMAVSFVSTILFNGNPLMRFDGYFILMDLLRLPNLSTRAMAYVKYLFMNRVLGVSLVANPATTPREVLIFTIYGIAAFCYRVFLYLAISMGVYYRFDKLLGIILAVLAFSLFVIRPLVKGVQTVIKSRNEIHPQLVGVSVFAALLVAVLAVLLIPIARISVYPCYMASAKVQKLTVPLQTSVAEVFIREGASASKGDLLFTLDTSLLSLTLLEKEVQREILRTEVKYFLLDEKRMANAPGKEIELHKVADEAERIKRDLFLAEAGIVAPFDGTVTSLDYKLQSGFAPGEGMVVGEFESLTDCVVYALIPSRDLRKVSLVQEVKIWFAIGTGIALTGRIDGIRPYSEQDLKNLPFSSRLGGELATEPGAEDRTDVPLEALYVCSVHLKNPDGMIPLGMTGKFMLHLPARSILARVFESVLVTFNKELIF
jgi:putative peptide zinc metalloprotease protein